ncbi:MAG: peptide ABC transporter permease [Candidatus Rokubacteria bacterium 13_1_40CM_2_68_8]|nr:MAG: peptide ABC transporter permease [Candidatus Rokubacteria bacterium 13_1_40CM_2_68_8]
MTERPPAVAPETAEDRISVASNRRLVWWRFRKHRLALLSALVLLALYGIVLFPDFLSTQDPEATEARLAFIPVQRLHLFDGARLRPWVPPVVGKRNPITLRMEWRVDESRRVPVGFFVTGYSYHLLGIVPARVHVLGAFATDGRERLYLLGTDRLGRDQWSRLVHGTRTSMTIGLTAVTFSVVLGVMLGGISGYFGGLADVVIQRLIELLQSLPTIPIWLALTAALPRDWSPQQVFFAITVILSLVGWTTLGREVRGRFLALREEDFVLAAELAGASRRRIIARHMVPTFLSHIIATSTLAIPAMIINETSLSFLGLGIRPPAISWGVLLQEAQNIQTVALAPWLLIPGLVVILSVLAFNLVGDGLRDAADPYSQ